MFCQKTKTLHFRRTLSHINIQPLRTAAKVVVVSCGWMEMCLSLGKLIDMVHHRMMMPQGKRKTITVSANAPFWHLFFRITLQQWATAGAVKINSMIRSWIVARSKFDYAHMYAPLTAWTVFDCGTAAWRLLFGRPLGDSFGDQWVTLLGVNRWILHVC